MISTIAQPKRIVKIERDKSSMLLMGPMVVAFLAGQDSAISQARRKRALREPIRLRPK